MRRIVITALLALAFPASALALRDAAAADGTLSVREGDGTVSLMLDRGAVIGRMVRGTLTIIEPRDGDCDTALVWEEGFRADGSERFLSSGAFACVFRGRNMRFRLASGHNDVVLRGADIYVSAVGRGVGTLRGRAGRYSLNGEPYRPLPDELRRFALGS